MRKAIVALWQFFKVIHSGSEEGSAKRMYGGIIIIAMLTLMYFASLGLIPVDTWIEIEGTFQYVFTIGATLLGLNIAVDLTKIAIEKRNKKGGTNDKPSDQQQ